MTSPRNHRTPGALGTPVALPLIAGVILLGIVSAISFRGTRAMVSSAGWTAHTYQVLGQLAAVSAGVNGLEAKQRVYLLTGSETDHQAFLGDTATLTPPLRALRRL